MSETDKTRIKDGVDKRLCSASDGGELADDASSTDSTDAALSEVSSACVSDVKDDIKNDELPPHPMRGSDYPDVGWGWLMCGAAFIAQFVCHGFQLASGMMNVGIQHHVNVTANQTGETRTEHGAHVRFKLTTK